MGVHRLVEIRQGGKTCYMVQQRIFGFWWVDRLTKPLTGYNTAKSCLEQCAAEYKPVDKKTIISVTDERLWDTPARPITPTPDDTDTDN